MAVHAMWQLSGPTLVVDTMTNATATKHTLVWASLPGSGLLYVNVAGPAQNCSECSVQEWQSRQLSTIQPTPTLSPTYSGIYER